MSAISVTCATLAATIATAQPGATLKLSQDCASLVSIMGKSVAAPGVTIDATGRTFKGGLKVWDSFGVHFLNGTYRTPANGSVRYAAYVRRGGRIAFTGGYFTAAYIGMFVLDTKGITVRNAKFGYLQSDGIDITGSAGDNGLIENNQFFGTAPKSGDHPDAVQTWANFGTLTIRNNRIVNPDGTAVNTMGFTTHGDGPPKKMDVSGNEIHTSYSSGIVNYAASGTVSGNKLWGDGKVRTYIFSTPKVKVCGNTLVDKTDANAEKPC